MTVGCEAVLSADGTEKVDPHGHFASFGFSPLATRSVLPHSHSCEKYCNVFTGTGEALLGFMGCGSGTRNDSPQGHLAVFPAASSETLSFRRHFEHSIEIMARLISGNWQKQYGKRTELQLLAEAVEIEKTASLVRIEGLEDVEKSVFPYPFAPSLEFLMKKMFVGCVALALPCLIAADTQAQKWADVTLTVVLEGKAPAAKLTDANAKDPQCKSPEKGVPSEELVVNPTNNGIANLVFTIDTKKTTIAEKDIHPDLREVPKTKPILDNLKCQFIPHIMAVRAGQMIEVKNSDSTAHNAKFAFFANEEKNPTIPAMSSVDIPTKLEEKAPTKVECNIHPWMSAYVMVFNHPYVGISDGDGKIKIEKLPAGVPLDFKIWHENQDKSIEEVTINGKKEKWVKGSTKMTLKEGANDLGKVVINIDRFKK